MLSRLATFIMPLVDGYTGVTVNWIIPPSADRACTRIGELGLLNPLPMIFSVHRRLMSLANGANNDTSVHRIHAIDNDIRRTNQFLASDFKHR